MKVSYPPTAKTMRTRAAEITTHPPEVIIIPLRAKAPTRKTVSESRIMVPIKAIPHCRPLTAMEVQKHPPRNDHLQDEATARMKLLLPEEVAMPLPKLPKVPPLVKADLPEMTGGPDPRMGHHPEVLVNQVLPEVK